MEYFHDYGPIPKVFWSFESGEVFRTCSMCDCDLLAPGTNYLIEKGFKKEEPIFEYAMCLDCVEKHLESLSVTSRKLIKNYFDEHVDLEQRRSELIAKHGRRTRSWLSRCMITGKPLSMCDEHQIYGWFVDKDIMFSGMPYMLSGQVMDQILDLLSEETIGVLNDFSEKVFGIGPPKRVIII